MGSLVRERITTRLDKEILYDSESTFHIHDQRSGCFTLERPIDASSPRRRTRCVCNRANAIAQQHPASKAKFYAASTASNAVTAIREHGAQFDRSSHPGLR